MSDFELRVAGTAYAGWTSLQLMRSMEQLAHSFSVELTDRWADKPEPTPIEVGNTCEIWVDKKKITTGFIDSVSVDYNAKQRSLSIAGRSKTADLVDCAAIYAKGQWRKAVLNQIATDLCDPFGITVRWGPTAIQQVEIPFEKPGHTIEDGETAFNCIERAAKQRGVLMMTDADGDLVFERAGTIKIGTVLEYGKNILRGHKEDNWEERFSSYTVKVQATGNNNRSGRNSAAISRTSTDEFVSGYRPTIIMGDSESSGTAVQTRADWERNIRAGKSRKYSYAVTGWHHGSGLWEPNRLVRVKDPNTETDEELLIVSVNFSRDSGGTTTTLELLPKLAFDIGEAPE